jgi:hypothetical protein
LSGSGPTQTEALLTILEKTISSARDALLPACIWAVRPDLAESLRYRSGGFNELLPPAQNPSLFAGIPGVPVEFPKTGEWRALYGRYVSTFIGAGLQTGNSQLLLLVIAALTQLCTETAEVSSKIDPFIQKGLAQIEPRRPSTVLLTFAFHFCFTRSSSEYSVLIDRFIEVFRRLRLYLEEFIEEHLGDLWDPQKAAASTVALKTYVTGFTIPIPEILQRAIESKDANEAEWIQTLAGRVLEALRPGDRLKARIASFDGLIEWINLLASAEIREAIPIWKTAEAWSPILRLARRVDPIHPLFTTLFFPQAQPLPTNLLEEIADWPAQAPRVGDTGLEKFIRPSVIKWLEGDVDPEIRDRVISGLWRFSAL